MTRSQSPSGRRRAVAVIGAGYVGLPTAALLAHFGHRVVCAEPDPDRLTMLERGEMPIVEEGLGDLVAQGVGQQVLRFVARPAEAVTGAEVVFLCVPTPQGDDGSADLSYVETAAREIGPHLAPGAIVVNKSTVPVGTATLVERIAARADVRVVANPEFLREGTAVHDSLHPDRIVVGADDREAAQEISDLFAPTGAAVVVTDTVTAETIKYASNAFLATKLSFINAMATLCEAVGADVADVMVGLGHDHRIGFDYLAPGPGWGGSCLPKDTRALVRIAEQAGYDFALLRGAIAINEEQLAGVVAKVAHMAGTGSDPAGECPLEGTTVAVWGLSFKATTNDRRCSPAVDAAQRLLALGARVQAYDPTVDPGPEGTGVGDLSGLVLRSDPYEASRGAAVTVVLTEWPEFRTVDFDKVRDLMARPALVDARNLLDPVELRSKGFAYVGVGRPRSLP